METKTIEQWFNELPEPYRSHALKNTLNQYGEKRLKVHEPSIIDALLGGFIWKDTPKEQGVDYWRNFCNTL